MQILHVLSVNTSSLSGIIERQDGEARSKVCSFHENIAFNSGPPLKQSIINPDDKRSARAQAHAHPARSTLLV